VSHEHRVVAREYMGQAVLGIRIRRIRMFVGLQDPDPLVKDPDPSFIEIMLAKQDFNTKFSLHSDEMFR
jgi:hypothetical protein